MTQQAAHLPDAIAATRFLIRSLQSGTGQEPRQAQALQMAQDAIAHLEECGLILHRGAYEPSAYDLLVRNRCNRADVPCRSETPGQNVHFQIDRTDGTLTVVDLQDGQWRQITALTAGELLSDLTTAGRLTQKQT